MFSTYAQQSGEHSPRTVESKEAHLEMEDLDVSSSDTQPGGTEPCSQTSTWAQAPPRMVSPKNTRSALRIGTLNIRGFRAVDSSRSESKWNHVNQVIRDKKIGILCQGIGAFCAHCSLIVTCGRLCRLKICFIYFVTPQFVPQPTCTKLRCVTLNCFYVLKLRTYYIYLVTIVLN